jgi:UDP-N-acetyl-D-mannosaminuronate dehydrogenase
MKPMFDATGLKLDEDYFLAFSPERVDPGNEKFNTKNITKVVGGVTETSAAVASAIYGAIVDNVHPVSSARVAEACKLLENTFRAVNIGLVNELARLCDTLGIDTWEVIAAAATKPFGFMPFYPGPGIGGHCLVGDETFVVRDVGGSRERIEQLSAVFDEQHINDQVHKFEMESGGKVIFKPALEALSLDPETKQPRWKPVSYLFRRKYEGNLVTITTSDNRRLTVTDEHPMLVSDELGGIHQVFAKDVTAGARLPVFVPPAPLLGAAEVGADPKLDLIPLLPERLTARIRVRINDGSWRDHRETLKRDLCAEVVREFIRRDYLPLSDFLRLEKVKRARPYLQLKGHKQLSQMQDWMGAKGNRLTEYFTENRRINVGRTFRTAGGLTTVAVKSVEIRPVAQPVDVFSVEVEDTHTFATSYGIFVHNCIPLDPHYLSWKARMHGFEARFISLAEEVNSRMPDHVVDLVARGLNNHRKPVNGSKVLVMGVAYKREIDDMRESPALGIIEKLQSLGADVQFHDPYVEEIHLEGNGNRLRGIELNSETVCGADCVVIVTDHRKIDYAWLSQHARLVVDTRNATRGLSDFEEKIIRL